MSKTRSPISFIDRDADARQHLRTMVSTNVNAPIRNTAMTVRKNNVVSLRLIMTLSRAAS